jgi:hypothetical protein
MIGNRIIDRSMFEMDMKQLDPATVHLEELCFCSPFLVNALLAYSCIRASKSDSLRYDS